MKKEQQARPTGGHKDRNSDTQVAAEIQRIDTQREKAARDASRHYEIISKRLATEKPQRVTPWLLLRFAPTDLGLRPIPTGTPYWASPDIWIESESSSGNPVAGKENFVHARIFNLGAQDAAPVKVDFYWADPSLGLGAPTMNWIGTEWVEIKSLQSKDIRCRNAWIPHYLNNGHECVMVNCSGYVLDPIKHPFEPVLDRHVGQRNLHVENVIPGQTLQFQFSVHNIFPMTMMQQVTARIQRLEFRKELHLESPAELLHYAAHYQLPVNTALELKDRYHTASPVFKTAQQHRKLALDNRLPPQFSTTLFRPVRNQAAQCSIQTELKAIASLIPQPDAFTTMGHRLLSLDMLSTQARTSQHEPAHLLNRFELNACEQKKLDVAITVPADARPGEILVIHLEQESTGISLGGYTCVFHVIR